jgi:hypothetical protein
VNNRDEFYLRRDQRTVEYGVSDIVDALVGVVIGQDAAETRSGQLCALALLNMLARLHRSIRLVAPGVPLLVPFDGPATHLDEACRDTIMKIDPFNDLVVHATAAEDCLPSGRTIGLGHLAPQANLWIGASGYLGEVGGEPADFVDYGNYYIGAGIAACLGAAAALRLAADETVAARRISFWEFSDGADATRGPDCPVEPLDVGRVWMIGAGAVGSAVAYWLSYPRVRGDWMVFDKDTVELHNTNRTLCLYPEDAGWHGRNPSNKAPLVASRIGAESVVGEYGKWATSYSGQLPDLILPLANENGVRGAVSNLGQPLLLHAATGRSWEAHFHRHVLTKDDCINCRLPESAGVELKCSQGVLPAAANAEGTDASLPFLSATAGLMLVAALSQLHLAGPGAKFLAQRFNRHSLLMDLRSERSWQSGVCTCTEGRVHPKTAAALHALHAGSRWYSLMELP